MPNLHTRDGLWAIFHDQSMAIGCGFASRLAAWDNSHHGYLVLGTKLEQ